MENEQEIEYYKDPFRNKAKQTFCKLMKEGIKDEASAEGFYQKLIDASKEAKAMRIWVEAPWEQQDPIRIATEILGDEKKHLVKLKELYDYHCQPLSFKEVEDYLKEVVFGNETS